MSVEYLITPAGPSENSWSSTPIGVPDPNPLNNFRVSLRYYTEDPTDGVTRDYPGFRIVTQTLECISPNNGDVFHEEEEFPPSPTFTADGDYLPDAYAVAGITDGSAYAYAKVFDETEFRIIETTYIPPKAPPAVDGSVEVNSIPLEPYDPDNDIYPYDAITKYNPDKRDQVTVTYKLQTTLRPANAIGAYGAPVTYELNITQDVTQTITDWSDSCKEFVSKAGFTNGLYNTETL